MKYALGVDIGGTSTKFAYVGEDGAIGEIERIPADENLSGDEYVALLAKRFKEYIDKNSDKEMIGIGIACPGSIDSKFGICEYSNNLRWENVKVAEIVNSLTNKPVKVANDANVAVLGEATFGEAKQYENVVLLTLGTGVGGGLFLNGRLYEGQSGMGAELGHMIIIKDGVQCTCGEHGCLEAYASITALNAQTKEALEKHPESKMHDYLKKNGGKINGKVPFECAKQGDEVAKDVVSRYLDYLGTGLVSICSIFKPDVILLSGGLCNQGPYLVNPLKAILEKHHYGFGGRRKCDLKIAKLGDLTGIYGASALFLERK